MLAEYNEKHEVAKASGDRPAIVYYHVDYDPLEMGTSESHFGEMVAWGQLHLEAGERAVGAFFLRGKIVTFKITRQADGECKVEVDIPQVRRYEFDRMGGKRLSWSTSHGWHVDRRLMPQLEENGTVVWRVIYEVKQVRDEKTMVMSIGANDMQVRRQVAFILGKFAARWDAKLTDDLVELNYAAYRHAWSSTELTSLGRALYAFAKTYYDERHSDLFDDTYSIIAYDQMLDAVRAILAVHFPRKVPA